MTRDKNGNLWREVEDMHPVLAAKDRVLDELCIDRSRVFLISNGDAARIGTWFLCEQWVTAAAFNSWTYHSGGKHFDRCVPRKLPMLWLNPLHSAELPRAGGLQCDVPWSGKHRVSLAEVENIWRKHNGCSTELPDRFDDENGQCRGWKCDVPLRSCQIAGGRGWPGTHRPPTNLCRGKEPPAEPFAIEEVIWEFFDAQPPLRVPTQ